MKKAFISLSALIGLLFLTNTNIAEASSIDTNQDSINNVSTVVTWNPNTQLNLLATERSAGTYVSTTRTYTTSSYPSYINYAYYDYTLNKTLSGTLYAKSVSKPTATMWRVVYSGYVY